MIDVSYKKHLNKLKAIQKKNQPLSIYDLRVGLFEKEIANHQVTLTELIKHKFASKYRSDGKIVKVDKHARAFDYIISVNRYTYDKNVIELMVATVYISTHSDIDDDSKERYRDNPMYDRRYGITKIELRKVCYNKLHPETGYSVTKYSEV